MLTSQYIGVWRRNWIDRYHVGIHSPTRETRPAIWFQSRTYHVDLRIDPVLAAMTCLDKLPSTQIAFAGRTEVSASDRGEICRWQPTIAYPFLSGEVDAGYMHFESPVHLMERGLDNSYVESWQRVNRDDETIQCLRFASIDDVKQRCFLMLCGCYFAIGSDVPHLGNSQVPVLDWGERLDRAWIVRESLAPWDMGCQIEIDEKLTDSATYRAPPDSEWTLPLLAEHGVAANSGRLRICNCALKTKSLTRAARRPHICWPAC